VAQSYVLRLLIHYMGDVHQPLHCEQLYDAENPTGDEGANNFALPNHYSSDNLHSVWDKMIYSQHTSFKRPMDDDQWTSFVNETAHLVVRNEDVVADTSAFENFDVTGWATDSYNYAIQAYEGVTPNEAVPDEYIEKWVPITE